jgi:hypothetical protein
MNELISIERRNLTPAELYPTFYRPALHSDLSDRLVPSSCPVIARRAESDVSGQSFALTKPEARLVGS